MGDNGKLRKSAGVQFRMQGTGRIRILTGIALIAVALFFSGCGAGGARIQERSNSGIENEYLGVLDTLTEMMRDTKQNPSKQLESIRSWVSENHESISETLKQFDQDVSAMSPEEREQWRVLARPELEKRLDAYARSQLAFQKRLNATQKWELGEILSQLK